MSLSASKNNLVHELFVRTADENYITARWCAINRLNTDFLWLAVHALEKYLKSVLLVNDCSSKDYSHDIARLYAAVKGIAGPLLPDRLTQPANLDILFWFERSGERASLSYNQVYRAPIAQRQRREPLPDLRLRHAQPGSACAGPNGLHSTTLDLFARRARVPKPQSRRSVRYQP